MKTRKRVKSIYVVFIGLLVFLSWWIINIPAQNTMKFFSNRPDVVFLYPEMVDHKDGEEIFFLKSDRAELFKSKSQINLKTVTINTHVENDIVNVYSVKGKYLLKDSSLELENNTFVVSGNMGVEGKSDRMRFNKGDSKLYLEGNVVLIKEKKKVIAQKMLYDVKNEDMYIEKRATINFNY